MTSRIATVLARGESIAVAEEINASIAARMGDESPQLVVLFASTKQPLRDLAPLVAARFPKATVLGASTAGEFTEKLDAKGSVAAFALAGDYVIHAGMASGLRADSEATTAAATAELPTAVDGYPHSTALVLLDPLAGNSEAVSLLIASALGEGALIAGGAAGDDLQMKETTVSLGRIAKSDAVVVARIFSKQPLGIGVAHGHRPLSPPLRVTRTSGATVHEIDGRAAWDVWREQTRAAARAQGIDVDTLTADSEGGFLLRYEAGLAAGDGYKIRAPLSRSEGSVAFATEIPEGSVIRIMESGAGGQIASAREAAKRAREALGGAPVAGALAFDCICRNLILGAEFLDAVHAIAAELGDAPLAGFETYGEIALTADDMSGFHNTTSVVVAFP